MGRTETDRKITCEPWSSTLGQRNGRNQTLFEVNGEVRSKKDLTWLALLEMSGNATCQELRNIAPGVRRIFRAQCVRHWYTSANDGNNSSPALFPRSRHALAYRVVFPGPARDRSGNYHLSPTVLLGRDR